jgi:hypothetical protein
MPEARYDAAAGSDGRMTVGPDFAVWEGVYASFAEAPAIGPGFAGDIWPERSLQAARELAARLERPSEYEDRGGWRRRQRGQRLSRRTQVG